MAVTDVLFSGLVTTTTSGDSVANPQTDAAGRSGVLNLALYHQIAIFAQLKTLTGGTVPTVQVIIDNADGQASPYWAHLNGDAPSWTSAVDQYRTSAGPGTSHNETLATLGRILWNISGGPSGCTFFVHIEGKR